MADLEFQPTNTADDHNYQRRLHLQRPSQEAKSGRPNIGKYNRCHTKVISEYRVLPMNYKAYGVLPVGVEENFQSIVGYWRGVFKRILY